MPLFRRLATLATAAEAARRYARSNPEQTARYVDQAARFLDKQTKGRYRSTISGVAQKAKDVAGVDAAGPGSTGGHASAGPPAQGEPYPGTP